MSTSIRKTFGILAVSALTLISLAPATSWGHARILPAGPVPPRDPNPGIKAPAPCGPAAPGSGVRTILTAGSVLNFRWEETINHPGQYRIAFSPDGVNGFDQNILATIPDVQDGGGLPHQYNANITLPNTPCNNCALQLIQVMTDRNPPTNYYSCADIMLVPAATPTPTPAPSPTPSPTPMPGATPGPTPSPTPVPSPTPTPSPQPTVIPAPQGTPVPTMAPSLPSTPSNGGTAPSRPNKAAGHEDCDE
jgi:hypothetical protein